ncbi:MAG: T9SS type A sorting domain-containing protein [Bacteroidales bacterium]|nr:T9SS type A sorting domain-containing protein [Bacteroidales bacterium]
MNEADFTAAKVMYLLPPEDPLIIEGIKAARFNNNAKALQYATERAVDLSPEQNGEWVRRDGMHIWRVHLISPEAYSLGVQFSEFALEKGARVFIYDPSGKHLKGAFNHQNNKEYGTFYVGHIPGEEVIIELQVDDPGRNYGVLRVGLLSHAFLPVYAEKGADNTGLGTSQDCEIDVNCSEGEEWQIIKRSVCHINTTRLLCTGVLVNNTSYNGKPYILTAEHCINTAFYAENSVFYFGYENSECGVNDGQKKLSVSGSALLATGDSIDFSLVELSERPPRAYNVYYAGWDAREMEHASSVTLHHPNADAMKISFDNEPTSVPTSVPGDLKDYLLKSNFWIKEWDIGSTEGGSSGAPLFNNFKKVIGVLSGGLASCGDSMGYDELNDRVIFSLDGNENDYYSRLSYGWDHYAEKNRQLKKWLDPVATGQRFIGGLTPGTLGVHASSANETQLSVYPNPATGTFTITLPAYSGNTARIRIYELTGQLVYDREHTSAAPFKVALPNASPGIFLIRVEDSNDSYTGKVVLQ